MVKRNDTFTPFERITVGEDWVDQLRTMYPSWEKETTDWAHIRLPPTVLYEAHEQGKKVTHNIKETRNLFLINTAEDFDKLCDLIEDSPIVALDTEFKATMCKGRLDMMTNEFKLAGVCISVDPFRGYYIPIGHEEERDLFYNPMEQISMSHLRSRFNSIDWESKLTIAQNFKIEVNAFARSGIYIPFVYDTMVGAKLIDNRKLVGLKAQTYRICGYEPIELGAIWRGLKKEDKNFCKMDINLALAYAGSDPVNTFRIAISQWLEFEKLTQEASARKVSKKYCPSIIMEKIEIPLMGPLSRMEQVGLHVDADYLLDLADKMDIDIEKIQKKVFDMIGIKEGLKLSSVQQREALFFEMMRIPSDEDQERKTNTQARDIMRDKINDYIEDAQLDARRLTSAKSEESWQILDGKQIVIEVYHNIKKRGGGTQFKFLTKENTNYDTYKKIIQSVNEEIEFHQLQLEFLNIYDTYSTLSKLRGTYTTSIVNLCIIAHDGLYHTSFTQCLNSGRLSCSPNLQNLPADSGKWDIRKAFIAPEGYVFVLCDWTAMEMKIAAAVSKCPVLTGIVTGKTLDNDGDPIDIHAYTASATLKKGNEDQMVAYMRFKRLNDTDSDKYDKIRYKAKRVNFGILYGITAVGLSAQLKSTRKEAQRFIDAFFSSYPGVGKWIKETHAFAIEQGYTMTPLGRYRRVSKKARKNKRSMENELKALQNHVIQGAGADFAKMAITRIDSVFIELKLEAKQCLMIHDEIIVLAPVKEAYIVKALLEKIMTVTLFGIELDVDAQIKHNLSKSSPDLSKERMKIKQVLKDSKGETIYKDGSPVETMVDVETPGYIPHEGLPKLQKELSKRSADKSLNALLHQAQTILDGIRNKVPVGRLLESAEEEIEDLQELIPD